MPLLQAQEQLGTCCLYTVIEWAREQLPEWLAQSAAAAKEAAQERPVIAESTQPAEARAQDDDEVCKRPFPQQISVAVALHL